MNKHLYKKAAFPEEFWPISLTEAIEAEDKVWYDTGNQKLVPLSDDTNAAYFPGVCMDQVPVNLTGVDFTPNPPQNRARVVKLGQFVQLATAAEAYNPGDKVYASALGPKYITVVAGSNPVGYVSGEQDPIASATAGQNVLVCLRANYPVLPIN